MLKMSMILSICTIYKMKSRGEAYSLLHFCTDILVQNRDQIVSAIPHVGIPVIKL